MPEQEKPCDLCGLPVKISGFELRTTDGLKSFCCEGCVGIYSMLHNPELVDENQVCDTAEQTKPI
jgi:hypothetical protein